MDQRLYSRMLNEKKREREGERGAPKVESKVGAGIRASPVQSVDVEIQKMRSQINAVQPGRAEQADSS